MCHTKFAVNPREQMFHMVHSNITLTVRLLLYGKDDLELEENTITITKTLRFIKDTKSLTYGIFVWTTKLVMFNSDCVGFFIIVNISHVIILLMCICISSLLVWISKNMFQT